MEYKIFKSIREVYITSEVHRVALCVRNSSVSSSLVKQMNAMKAIHIPWWIWIVGNTAMVEDTSDFVVE